jgi:hypothetical protein
MIKTLKFILIGLPATLLSITLMVLMMMITWLLSVIMKYDIRS